MESLCCTKKLLSGMCVFTIFIFETAPINGTLTNQFKKQKEYERIRAIKTFQFNKNKKQCQGMLLSQGKKKETKW